MRKTREVGIRLSVKDDEQVKRAFKSIGAEGKAALDKIDRAARAPSTSLLALNRATIAARGTIGGLVGGMSAALIPTLSLAAAIGGTKAALDKFGETADRAKSANLDSELFQAIAYQAKLAGVELGEVAGALDTFRKNAELAAAGRGKLFTQLKALNPELLSSIQLAGSQEVRLRMVADALAAASDKAALASAIFGEAGPRMVAVFEDGAAAIDLTMNKARALGLIVDREIIAKADEYGDKWDTAATIIDTQVKVALTNLAPGMLWLVEKAAQFAQFMNDATSGNKPMFAPSWGDQTEQHLGDVLRGLAYPDASVSGLPRRYSEGQYQFGDMEAFFNAVTKNAVGQLRSTGSSEPGDAMDFRAFLDQWYENSLEGYPDVFRETGAAAKAAAADVKGNVDAVTDLSAAWRTAEEATKSFASDFIRDLSSGKSAIEALQGALGSLSERLLQMAMDQSISQLFSGLSLGGGAGTTGGSRGNGLWGTAIFNAKGNVFGGPSLGDFSNRLVRSRTEFFARGGRGVMGEAGTEAILPLVRDARGRLGVNSAGGSAPSLNVTVVNNTGDRLSVDKSASRGRDGSIDWVLTVERIAADSAARPGGALSQTLQTVYGMRRQLTGRG